MLQGRLVYTSYTMQSARQESIAEGRQMQHDVEIYSANYNIQFKL